MAVGRHRRRQIASQIGLNYLRYPTLFA